MGSCRAGLRTTAHHAKILNGSIILLIGSVFVSLANFGYNIGVARMLGPSDFSHAAAAVTILMLISAITLAFQLVCTKLVAKADTTEAKAAVFQHLMKRAWAIGIGLGVFMLLASSVLTAYLRLSSPWIIILLAVGLTIYVPLGVKRGGLQGTCRFRGLSWNMAAEAIIKFVGAIVLIELGFGVLGAVAAISGSVIFAFCLPDSAKELRGRCRRSARRSGWRSQAGHRLLRRTGHHQQHRHSDGEALLSARRGRTVCRHRAGRTAAVLRCLVGRERDVPGIGGEEGRTRLRALAGDSAAAGHGDVGGVRSAAGGVSPNWFFSRCSGRISTRGIGGLNWLLSMNAAATGIYAIAVVLITYEMSRRIANTGWLQLVVSGLIVLGITWFHSTLLEVIVVQQVLRVLLLCAVAFPFVKMWATAGGRLHEEATARY